MPQRILRSNPRRFSLASALLFICTLGAWAAWWGANQRSERAIGEVNRLRLLLEQYQAELGQLTVIDPTKVHAIGLRLRPEDRLRWKWRVYLPQTRSWQLLLVDGSRSLDRDAIKLRLRDPAAPKLITVAAVPPGEFVMEAAIVPRNGKGRQSVLVCAINGQPTAELLLPDFDPAAKYDSQFSVFSNDRSVWEPGEQALLLSLRDTGNSATARTVAIWLWESSSPQPQFSPSQAAQ